MSNVLSLIERLSREGIKQNDEGNWELRNLVREARNVIENQNNSKKKYSIDSVVPSCSKESSEKFVPKKRNKEAAQPLN